MEQHCVDLDGLSPFLGFPKRNRDIPRLSDAHANGFNSCFELACTEYDLRYGAHFSNGHGMMVGAIRV